MKIIDVVQKSPEWHAFRRAHVMASDMSAIMGINPWKSAYATWLDKLGMGKEIQINEAMQRGIDLEDEVRNMLNISTSKEFLPVVVESSEYPILGASLDGYYHDTHTDEKYICEIKCSNKIDLSQGIDAIPEYYYVQCQDQLLCTGADVCFFCNYRDNKLIYIPLFPNKGCHENIIVESKKFWDLVQNFEAPELTSKDYIERNDVDYKIWSDHWKIYQEEKNNLVNKEIWLRKWAATLSQGQNCKGFDVSIQHTVRKGNIDYGKIEVIKNMDLEQYRKPPIKITTIR